jgi:hypothetical protein
MAAAPVVGRATAERKIGNRIGKPVIGRLNGDRLMREREKHQRQHGQRLYDLSADVARKAHALATLRLFVFPRFYTKPGKGQCGYFAQGAQDSFGTDFIALSRRRERQAVPLKPERL